MRHSQIVSHIKAIVKSEKLIISEEDKNFLRSILWDHQCYYLLKLWGGVSVDSDFGKLLFRNQLKAKEELNFCKNIFVEMENNKIPYAILKGFGLSYSIYGSTSYRNSKDIDFLIKPVNLNDANNILLDLGYQQGSFVDENFIKARRESRIFHIKYAHQAMPYVKKVSGRIVEYIMIDLNVDLLWGENDQKCDMDYILDNTTNFELYDVIFFKLKSVFEFISLCLHHYRDLNSLIQIYKGKYKLSVFCDIYFYLLNNSIDPQQLFLTASKMNVVEYIYHCLFLTNEIFDDIKLKPYLNLLYSQQAETTINRCGLVPKEYKVWPIPLVDRLFSINAKEIFQEMLDQDDKEKIRLNIEMMN